MRHWASVLGSHGTHGLRPWRGQGPPPRVAKAARGWGPVVTRADGTARRVFVALDFVDLEQALRCADQLRPTGVRFKVGLELFCRTGPEGLRTLFPLTGPVFLDLKLHDIPRTVAGAVRAAAALGVWGLTVHATGGEAMLRAAVAEAAAADRPPRCLAVTALTSLDQAALAAVGVQKPLRTHVSALTQLALTAGCDGVVASPEEAAVVRSVGGPSFLVVTPGVRPLGSAAGDQARVATPAAAMAAGADYLVIGRPVTTAADPLAVLRAVLSELDQVRGEAGPLPARM